MPGAYRWHRKWLTITLIVCVSVLFMYASTTSRPMSSKELESIDYIQPVLTSSGFEMGIWTGHPGHVGKAQAPARQAERSEAEAVRQLAKELQDERDRAREQQLEIERLRSSLLRQAREVPQQHPSEGLDAPEHQEEPLGEEPEPSVPDGEPSAPERGDGSGLPEDAPAAEASRPPRRPGGGLPAAEAERAAAAAPGGGSWGPPSASL
ncbi:unnamed protein product [Prorocentrum cordatum]|uniref:Uncharacterized protein n=1 Tax=Prorocentrum cordatum TaxID=2364126 RepID=A0ABN9Y4L5_9DINO|nr:unnamed protein product [Polarella glacialis]